MKPRKITTTAVAIMAFGASSQALSLPAVGNKTTFDNESMPISLGNSDGAVKSKKMTEEEYFHLQLANNGRKAPGGKQTWEKLLDIIFDVDVEGEESGKEANS